MAVSKDPQAKPRGFERCTRRGPDEGADVGEDGETPVVEDYGIPAPYKFTGAIAKVTVDIEPMQPAHKAAEGLVAAEADFKKRVAE